MKRDWRSLRERLESGEATVGVIGLGYAGLPVATAFAEKGFRVVGVDVDPERVRVIESGGSYVGDVPPEDVARLRKTGRLRATRSYRRLSGADAVIICTPTPITDGAPDLSAIEAAGRALGRILSPGALVILESTTYPGTTEELLQPLLESEGLVAGRDFLLAYSPERIDPGNSRYGFGEITKVVGGIDEDSTRAAEILFSQVIPKVVTVSSPREAEMSKLIENTFRHANIALVNELAVYARGLGVDIWESIEAAATKPFGFVPFWPSPGWGGHCIPLDPAFLSWRVRQHEAHEVRFIELAHQVNSEMRRYVVERTGRLLNERSKPVNGSRILGVGIAYKGGVEDTRGSPGIRILRDLAEQGAKVDYHDPLVPEIEVLGRRARSVPLTPKVLRRQDLVLVLVPQAGVDWDLVAREAPLVFDCCNALRRSGGRVVRL